jgi:hypothetical protein
MAGILLTWSVQIWAKRRQDTTASGHTRIQLRALRLDLIPSARVVHVGPYRDPETLVPMEYYPKLPDDLSVRPVVVRPQAGRG